ncbi:MAG TPA: allantoate amidohydrolase [Xanthobacteraceae bacterium]|nr:allantoate amidohydrolase [Xanthobacteraceae bacterium]
MTTPANAIDIDDLGHRAETMIDALAAISSDPTRLVRLFLTPEHRRAADVVAAWMREAKLDVTEDALGTVRGHLAGAGSKRLLIGSHIDTVVDAGRFDGIFGVVAGILAARHIAISGKPLPFSIDVLAFGDEEGSRFPTTLSSSAAVAGNFDPARCAQAGVDGITLDEAIRAYGKSPDEIAAAAYRRGDVAAYVEVHIEQGPVLEAGNQPLGVVTAIAGQTYLTVEFSGEAGHAGTVPMRLRRDALVGASEMVLFAERVAREYRGEVVATVGRMTMTPNAANVIPANVTFTLDLRTTSDVTRAEVADRFRAEARGVAERRQLGLAITQTRDTPTTPCDIRLQDGLAEATATLGFKAPRLPSGAGHDGQAMSKLCPVGMLFVRCRGGISHNPAEYASAQDMGIAVAALIEFILRFDVGV